MWSTQMNTTVQLISENESALTGKIAEVILDNVRHVFLFQNEDREENDHLVIHNCRISLIEDGLYQIVFIHNQQVTTGIIDLMNSTIEMTTILENRSYMIQKGSFNLITKENQVDHSCMTNADIAIDFWLRFFDQHDESAIDDYLLDPYIQHNPKVADGIKAFKDEFHHRFFTDMKECSTEIKRVVSRGNLVFIHNILKRNPNVKGHAAVDIFRVENKKIVEHWDVIQPMPETSKNDHPMF